MLATYRHLRRALYLAAFALPVVLLFSGGSLKDSISAYYDDADWKRDVFVGTLFAVGFGILSYKGFNRKENIALNLSGLMAFGIALIPHRIGEEKQPWHFVCAITFFLGIVYVCVFRAEDTLALTKKKWMADSYKILGYLIVALPALIWLVRPAHYVFWAEAAAVWVFGAFWWLKTEELSVIERSGAD